ncbi:12668_t:CDS:2 [Acaulospora morrowiae]|uniref:12668_t:CDS:1 n=1 Tax=Acaulospora morrowiae TaxID=94023 RepID=A0A9N9HN55_9GLOM|nr:12668_t:CDS:2 [Acaulospora morrowiae]
MSNSYYNCLIYALVITITFVIVHSPTSAVVLPRQDTINNTVLEASSYHIVSSNLCDPSVKQYSGYIKTGPGQHMFFWFFESRKDPKNDPLTLWLNGGPGCTSMFGLFVELGPCYSKNNGSDTVINPYSWNNVSNMLFVDQPIDVGYSFGKGIVNSTAEAVVPLYTFLQKFLARFPEYSKQDFHFFGESYAGHYIPATAKYIYDMNQRILEKKEEGIFINLKSLGIGNGDVDPYTQIASYPTFARYSSYGQLVSEDVIKQMESYLSECKRKMDKCDRTNTDDDCATGFNYCNLYILGTYDANSGLNDYDVRLFNTTDEVPYDYLNFINNPQVKKAIGAKSSFKNCNRDIYWAFRTSGDQGRSFKNHFGYLLDRGVRILNYNGDADYILNWFGTRNWTNALEWNHKKEFNSAPFEEWFVQGKPAGQYQQAYGFWFVRVYGAGHEVPYFQPLNSLYMFEKWINLSSL